MCVHQQGFGIAGGVGWIDDVGGHAAYELQIYRCFEYHFHCRHRCHRCHRRFCCHRCLHRSSLQLNSQSKPPPGRHRCLCHYWFGRLHVHFQALVLERALVLRILPGLILINKKRQKIIIINENCFFFLFNWQTCCDHIFAKLHFCKIAFLQDYISARFHFR